MHAEDVDLNDGLPKVSVHEPMACNQSIDFIAQLETFNAKNNVILERNYAKTHILAHPVNLVSSVSLNIKEIKEKFTEINSNLYTRKCSSAPLSSQFPVTFNINSDALEES